MTMKKKILTTLSVVLILGMAALGILAYLSDTDSDVNVMTLGNVQIDQIEQERVDTAKLPTDDNNLTEFTSTVDSDAKKPLFPAVFEGSSIPWNANSVANQAWKVVETNDNVIDKFVTVKNTGVSDAYVRTLIAYEGDATYGPKGEWIHIVTNGTNVDPQIPNNFVGYINLDGVDYTVFEYVYPKALAKGETTIPSLKQVYMNNKATNEVVAEYGDTYDILVLSQAVQTKGFDDAAVALETAFPKGDNNANVIEWFYKVLNPADHYVSDLDGLKKAFKEGGSVLLTDDITCEKITPIEPGVDVYLDMNGKTITVKEDTTSNTLLWVQEGAKLTIDGNGTIDLGSVSTMAIFCPYGELVIENGTFIRDKVTTVTNATTGLFMGAKITSSNVTINGGYFDPGYYDKNAADIEDILAGTKPFTETADDIAKRGNSGDKNLVRVAIKDNVSVILNHSGYGSFKVYGGTFVGANPAWGDEGCMLPTTPNYLRPWSYYQGALLAGQTYNENGLVVPDGYTITRSSNSDGIPVYTVNYSK